MNVATRTSTGARIQDLAKRGEIIFHARDLANLWGIRDTNTLYTTLKRYVDRGILYRIYKGLYSLVPVAEIDPQLLGAKAIHRYGYVSTETVLVRAGIVMQQLSYYTLVSDRSLTLTVGEAAFRVRKLADQYLFNAVGVENRNGVKIATVSRAVADMLYFNPRAYFDNTKSIDWDDVRNIQTILGYPVTTRS